MIPKEVDCVILGTGLTNSILAAACSRIGKSVLHVDKNNYYGEGWASFTFQQLVDWIRLNDPENKCLKDIPEELMNKSRMFCIDLCPRLLYSNGPMVNLLVKSNVSRYHEFKNNVRVLSIVEDSIHVMPCRRSDVFTSPLLSDLIDKRRLMKLIEMCTKFDSSTSSSAEDEITKNAKKPIAQFLEENGLKPVLREYIINSIAMVTPSTPTVEACERIKQFIVATERFGQSPFIFPLYGCGEFPQSFCRLSAVFGGVYCLNTQVEAVEMNSRSGQDADKTPLPQNFIVKFAKGNQEVRSNMVAMDYASAVQLNLTSASKSNVKTSRAILITRKSIVPNGNNLLSFLRIPPSDANANLVYALEFNSTVMVCPSEINIVYLWTDSSSSSAENDLGATVERLFLKHDDENPISWKVFFQQLTAQQGEPIESLENTGLFITNPPSNDIDYEHCIKEAEKAFCIMCPNQEFLPRAPDPDEIISD